MKDKLLTYAICISIGAHLILLAAIGRTSAAKPIDVDQLRLVRVDLVKTPDLVKVQSDKPEVKPEPPKYNPPAPVVPPVHKMRLAPPVKPRVRPAPTAKPIYNPRPSPAPPKPVKIASAHPAGDPGGELNLGSSSSHGDIHVSQGSTGVGFVPSPTPGRGEGSGTGLGKATHEDPVKDASPGPGTEPAPEPAYVPPPSKIKVTVCEVSGLRPGPYCQKTTEREYIEGQAPTRICDKCRPPEPKHESRLADSRPAELIKDVDVRVPAIIKEAGGRMTVKVTYTVGEDGLVSDIEVTRSSGNPLLDRAVVDAWSRLKYRPAVQDGIPRSIRKRRTFTYSGG